MAPILTIYGSNKSRRRALFLAKKNVKEIYQWSLKNISKFIGVNKQTQWLRLNKDNGVRNIVKRTVKESWNG